MAPDLTGKKPQKNEDHSVILDILGGASLIVGVLSLLSGRNNQTLQSFIQDEGNRVARLADAWIGGQLNTLEFQAGMLQEIQALHVGTAVIANGGNGRLTPAMQAQVNRIVAEQQAYLNNWMAQIQARGMTAYSPAQLRARALMYVDAYRKTASIIANLTIGLPPMPFEPADRTRCHNHCLCSWQIRQLPGAGNFDCYWQLGQAEHCPTCLRRSRVAWPLQVRGGVIIDEQKYLARGLYYP